MVRKELKWANVMTQEAADKVAGWDASGNPVVKTAPAGDDEISVSARGIWEYQSLTGTPVADGKVRFNSTTIASITQMLIAQTSDEGVDAGFLYATLKSGDDVYFQLRADATKWVRFTINGPPVDNGSWWTFPVSVVNSGGALPGSATKCIVRFTAGSIATDRFKGSYLTLAALNAAVPASDPGDYAIVDAGIGTDVVFYVWDETDTKWVPAGVALTASNGLELVAGNIRLGGVNPITLATVLNITTGSLAVTGVDKPFTIKSTSGISPKLQLDGDGASANARNWEFEPFYTGAQRGLQLKYSSSFNTLATLLSFFFRDNGWVGIGQANASAALDVASTIAGFLPPRMTTAQRDAISSPPDGTILYNTTTNRITHRISGAWVEVGITTQSPLRESFRFNSSLFTEDQRMFRGLIGTLSGYFSLELSAISFEARLDSSSSWTTIADITALQTWISANISGTSISGTKFWIKVLATYSTSGIAEYSLTYTPT